MINSISYRAELDGLRAIAVLAVIIFHFNEDLLKGGFLGVDVFFVLSGYLITLLIIGQIQNDKFSLWEFWKRRIARLYPAMAAMVVAVLLVGHFVLVQPERGDLPLQAVAALFSFQNILLWKTTGGYWDAASESMPLLHTWSLSVEEQFYIIFPIALLLVHKFTKSRMNFLILSLFLASLFLCIVATPLRRSAAFYLLPTRMWELLIGAIVAVYWRKEWISLFNKRSLVSFQIIGIILIISSFFFIENDLNFPSFLPFFPSLGTAILLCFGSSPGIIQTLLSYTPIVYIGKISYSLYLWHWPVLVYSKSISLDHDFIYLSVTILSISVLSYHCIETPLRYRTQKSALIFVLSSACVLMACLPIAFQKSCPLLKSFGNIDDEDSLTRGYEFEATDAIVSGDWGVRFPVEDPNGTICLVGSSHARVLGGALLAFCQKNNLDMVSMATSDFGFSDTAKTSASQHAAYLEVHRNERLLAGNPQMTVIAGMWSSEIRNPNFKNDFNDRLRLLLQKSPVLVIGQVPMVMLPHGYEKLFRKYLVARALQSGGIPDVTPSPDVELANQQIALLIKEINNPNLFFFNPYSSLIDKNGNIHLTEKNKFLYSDNHHLNDDGAIYVFENKLNQVLLDLIKR